MTADVLSEVLSAVRLTGSVFFDVTAAAPWVAEAPPSAQIADAVRPGAQHAIEYHVITRGSCWISIVDGAPFSPVQLKEGDIAVIPHGEPHVVSSAPLMRAEPNVASHQRPKDDSDLPFKLRTGASSGSDAHLMCGFFTCDVRPFNPLIEALPRFMHIGRGASAATDALLDHFLHLASVDNTDGAPARKACSTSCPNCCSSRQFAPTWRPSAAQYGLAVRLARSIGGPCTRSLACAAGAPWTLDDLAAECGASRSALVGRFTQLMGYPPIQYLTRWRMQLAAKRLNEKGAKVSAVAQEVGYDFEAAFSRAFKKFSGQSPSEWRS